MSAERTGRLRRAGLAGMPLALALACAVLWVARPPEVRTSLFDMAGGGGVPEALRGRSEGMVPVIVSSPVPAEARAAADDLAKLLKEIDGASLPAETEDGGLAAMLGTILERRTGLVSPEDAQLLATPEGRARIARAALRRYATSPIPPLFPPAEDPFCLADRFVSSLPLSVSGWERHDGLPEAERDGKTHVLLPVSLAPRVAGGGRPLEAFARQVAEAADQVRAGHPDTDIAACGAPMHTALASARCRKEIGWLTLFSLAFIAGLSVLAFRGAGWIPLLAASLAVAAACGGLVLLLFFREIHAMALVFGTTVLGLVIDYSFHWLMAGETERQSVVRSLAASFATTEIGLLPLAFSSLPVLRQAAAFLAAGLLGALAYVVLCYPRGGAATGKAEDPSRRVRRCRRARWTAVAVLLVAVPGLFRARGSAGLDTLYRAPESLAAAEKLLAELGAGNGRDAAGGFLVTAVSGGTLEDLLAREAAAGLPESVPCLSRFLPPLERREEMAGLVAQLYEEHGARQAEWLALDALELPPAPRAWEWPDIPPYAADAFVADGALVVSRATDPPGELPDGVVFCRPSETLAAMLAEWTAEARQRLDWALAAMAAALVLLRGRNALADALPPLLALAAVAGGLGLAGEGIGLFHLLAGFLLAGMGVDYAIFLRGQPGAFRPALCSMLTSVAGFGALSFVSMPPARAFGIVLGGGLPVAFLCALAAPPVRGAADSGGTEKCASPLGLEILYWIYRLFGGTALRLAASGTGLVAWLFSSGVRRSSPSLRRLLAFCRSLADKLAVMSGKGRPPAVESDGSEDMRSFAADVTGGRGVFVLSSHCGTIEVLSALGDVPAVFHAWVDFSRTSVFSAFYLRHARNRRVVLHPIGDFGPETVFEAGDLLDEGKCLVMAGDSGEGRKLPVPFGDGELLLSEGAFRLARALGHPAYFVACIERKPGKYVVGARRLEGGHGDMARDYAEALRELVRKHPEQWFRWETDA